MNKDEFLKKLAEEISVFPKKDQEAIMFFYNECLNDALEAGENEKEFIKKLGSMSKLKKQLLKEYKVETKDSLLLAWKELFLIRDGKLLWIKFGLILSLLAVLIPGILANALVLGRAIGYLRQIFEYWYNQISFIYLKLGYFVFFSGIFLLGVGIVLFLCRCLLKFWLKIAMNCLKDVGEQHE